MLSLRSNTFFQSIRKYKFKVSLEFFKRANQRLSKIAMGILSVLVLFLGTSGIVLIAKKITSLEYVYFFSYVKLAITLMKYFPQVKEFNFNLSI